MQYLPIVLSSRQHCTKITLLGTFWTFPYSPALKSWNHSSPTTHIYCVGLGGFTFTFVDIKFSAQNQKTQLLVRKRVINFGGSVRVGGLGATEMWGRPSGIQQPLSSSPTTRSHLPDSTEGRAVCSFLVDMMVMMASQQIPTRWEYVIMMNGGNMT